MSCSSRTPDCRLLRRWLPLQLLLGLLLAGPACLSPTEPGALALHVRGPAYPRPRCAKGPAELGRLYPLGQPVTGAQVRLEPGDFRGVTDASGALSLPELPHGSYDLTIEAAGFAPQDGARRVTVEPGQTTELSLNLQPCVVVGGDHRNVGFDHQVNLTALPVCEQGWDQVSYTWTQVEGPDVRGSVTRWDSQVLSFTTRPLDEVRPLPDAPQMLSFSPDQAGQYVFQVLGRRPDGVTSTDYVLVTSTSVTGGMNSVPPQERYYFVGPKPGPWRWSILQWPANWPETLEGEETRTPSFRVRPSSVLNQQETLAIIDENSGTTFSVVVGDWDMVNRDCGRESCHPPLQASWERTRHAATWKRLLDGELLSARGPAAESCATCHSLGYDRRAPNGGYDDIADLNDVSFPATLKPGNYAALPAAVKEVSNVYCLACHGPARVDPPVAEQPGRFEVGVCARCHDRLPEQDLVAQWRQSRMAQTVKGELNGPESREECARCHTSQGFYYNRFALGRPPNDNVLVMTCCENLAPITCQTCHSPMYARNKAQIFAHDQAQTDSGLSLQGIGSGALCTLCHNVGHDTSQPEPLTQRLAPHSPQADISYGRGGYLLGPDSYPVPEGVACSSTAGDGCVTCHMDQGPAAGQAGYRKVGDHTFHMVSSEGRDNTRPCQACHQGRDSFDPRARHDYDGDAKVESVRLEVDGLMALLRQRLEQQIAARGYVGCGAAGRGVSFGRGYAQRIVVLDAGGHDLGDCDANGRVEREERPFVFPDQDLLLHKAAYNYLMVAADRSRGLHNLPFVVSLLQRSIYAVSGGQQLPPWVLFRPAVAR